MGLNPGADLGIQLVDEGHVDTVGQGRDQAGENAACKKSFLLKSGYGLKTISEHPGKKFNIADDLLSAAYEITASLPDID